MDQIRKHKKIKMKKLAKYRIINQKYIEAYKIEGFEDFDGVVTNLLGDTRMWTRVMFPCGKTIKINCHCLEKIE